MTTIRTRQVQQYTQRQLTTIHTKTTNNNTHKTTNSNTHKTTYNNTHKTTTTIHTRQLTTIQTRKLTTIHTKQLTTIHTRQLTTVHTRQLTTIHTRQLTTIHTRQLTIIHTIHTWCVYLSTIQDVSNLKQSGAEHVGEREGCSKDYTLYQRLTVQKNDLLMMSFPKARNM